VVIGGLELDLFAGLQSSTARNLISDVVTVGENISNNWLKKWKVNVLYGERVKTLEKQGRQKDNENAFRHKHRSNVFIDANL
jgi:hypothetical protein